LRFPWWGVLLERIRHRYPGRDSLEWAFHPRRSRPVEEWETDITVFREMAVSATATCPVTSTDDP